MSAPTGTTYTHPKSTKLFKMTGSLSTGIENSAHTPTFVKCHWTAESVTDHSPALLVVTPIKAHTWFAELNFGAVITFVYCGLPF